MEDLIEKIIDSQVIIRQNGHALGEIIHGFESCIYPDGVNNLPFSLNFNNKFYTYFEGKSQNCELFYSETGFYQHTSENELKLSDDNYTWYFINREFPIYILRKEVNIDNILLEFNIAPVVVGIVPNDTIYFELYACHDLTKDIEVLKIINKHRKPISLENFEKKL